VNALLNRPLIAFIDLMQPEHYDYFFQIAYLAKHRQKMSRNFPTAALVPFWQNSAGDLVLLR
jgi:hypothetical protein